MTHRYPPPPSLEELGLARPGAAGRRRSGDDLPKMKKFRFQLLADWIAGRFPPCTVADVGGGKGLLTHLLGQAGFQAEVVDPVDQPLPPRYRDLASGDDAGFAVSVEQAGLGRCQWLEHDPRNLDAAVLDGTQEVLDAGDRPAHNVRAHGHLAGGEACGILDALGPV
ncbi:MAG TPA: hypothetical protein VG411_05835 [Actinomycetota bacterium]|nr:hypothetical protein [Actinomycetota bacterium]